MVCNISSGINLKKSPLLCDKSNNMIPPHRSFETPPSALGRSVPSSSPETSPYRMDILCSYHGALVNLFYQVPDFQNPLPPYAAIQ